MNLFKRVFKPKTCMSELERAEQVLDKIAHGNPNAWQTIAAKRYFGWTWDKDGKAIPPK